MLTYLRYALATICFALSVGCLGLWWWRSMTINEYVAGDLTRNMSLTVSTSGGWCRAGLDGFSWNLDWTYQSDRLDPFWRDEGPLRFGVKTEPVAVSCEVSRFYFPLWYPAFVFAIAGVGALRLGRRFTLRSAIIATTVVAGLLGMVTAL